jgi:hypothetical protein
MSFSDVASVDKSLTCMEQALGKDLLLRKYTAVGRKMHTTLAR